MTSDLLFELAELEVQLQNIELYIARGIRTEDQIESLNYFIAKTIERIRKIKKQELAAIGGH